MPGRLVHDEQGIALVIALFTMLVLSITTAALLVVVAVNHRSSLVSANQRKAFGLAEVGLAYAEGRVYGAAAAHQTPLTAPTTVNQDGGTVTYWASVAGDGHTWTMYGRGLYQGIERDVTAQANVPSPVTVEDTGVWNYLYSDSTNGSCPTTISGSTTVSVPTFVRGNLCLQSSFTGSQLGVGGNLVVSGGNGGVGTVTSPINQLTVAGTCDGVASGTGLCDGAHSPIYAKSVSSSLPFTVGLPPLDLPTSYSTANPGPGAGHACQTGSNTPTPFFDNDGTLNNSLGNANLFPNSWYDCVNGSNEIKWCPSVDAAHGCSAADTLFVDGTFFFDGNLNLQGNTHVKYTGLGTIYVTGTISTSGNFSICGSATCGADWDTSTAALVFVAACWANADGSSLVTSKCVNYGGNNTMQVATYCKTNYFIAGTATNWGPVLADTLSLNGNMSELIPFKVMPPGTPTNTSTSYLPASAPTYWAG